MYGLLRKDKLLRFYKSDLAKRMKVAAEQGELYIEKPFVMGKLADEIEQDGSNTRVLVQGIIDAYFEEDGEIVLVDYKTDTVKNGEELIRRYETQVEYYKEALEKLTEKKVKEMILYSFALNQCVEVH